MNTNRLMTVIAIMAIYILIYSSIEEYQNNHYNYNYGAKKDTFAADIINVLKEPNSNTYYGSTNTELINKLSDGDLDGIIILSEKNSIHNNLRIVATLAPAYIHVLCNNGYRILDLSEIKNKNKNDTRKCKYSININTYNSHHQEICTLILNSLNISDDYYYYTDTENADIYFFIDSIPSRIIKNIVKKELLHFLNIGKLNNGDKYMHTKDEQYFYKTNPNLEKGLLYNKDVFNMYPGIFIPDRNNIFINTLVTHYIFLTRNNVNMAVILNKIKENIRNKDSPFYTNPLLAAMKDVTIYSLNKNNLKYLEYSN